MKPTPPEMLQGTVDILVLRALAWDSMHGYAISRWLAARSDGVLTVDGAALYQALHRLARRKWVTSSWGLSENNRKAKYYRLTPTGRKQLAVHAARWHQLVQAIGRILKPVEG